MTAFETGTVAVPGATLWYKTWGSGPVVLMLQGGSADADGGDTIAPFLADHFKLIAYDRRGLARSSIDNPEAPLQLQTHGEDVHHLLAALSSGPALLFGSSIGALVGLDVVTRHPEQVHTLVAHEPPLP